MEIYESKNISSGLHVAYKLHYLFLVLPAGLDKNMLKLGERKKKKQH